jgi:hypothetical protein
MIYVHPDNNPSGLEYNAILYCFMRSWNCPDVEGFDFKGDTWFAVPALRRETQRDVAFTIINSKIEMTAMMIVADNAMLLKATRVNLNQKVAQHQIEQITQQAFDIGKWEKMHSQPFPYENMFDGKLVQKRYQAKNGTNSEAYFSIASENSLFTEIKKKVSPKPCNCGKPQYVG